MHAAPGISLGVLVDNQHTCRMEASDASARLRSLITHHNVSLFSRVAETRDRSAVSVVAGSDLLQHTLLLNSCGLYELAFLSLRP